MQERSPSFLLQKVPEGKLRCRMIYHYTQLINHSNCFWAHCLDWIQWLDNTGYQLTYDIHHRQCSKHLSFQCPVSQSQHCVQISYHIFKSVFAKCTAIHLVNRFEAVVGTPLFYSILEQIIRATYIGNSNSNILR